MPEPVSTPDLLRRAEEHLRAGRFADAQNLCNQILRQNPDHSDALNLSAILARQQSQFTQAADFAARAVRASPNVAEFHANLGEFSRLAKMPQQAIMAFERAIRLKPMEPTFHNGLAMALSDNLQRERAANAYRFAVQLKPDYVEAWNNLAGVLREMGQLDESAEAIATVLKLQPRLPSAHLNLAIVRAAQERFPDAMNCYRQAIDLQPDYAEAHMSLGILHLLLGDFPHGWAEYRWRLNLAAPPVRPYWSGEDLREKTILLRAEQGFGDTIQFIRYVPLLARTGAKILLSCQPELSSLLTDLVAVLPSRQPFPPHDFQCPMLNLPLAFHTDLTNIPASVPYLKARKDLSQAWSHRLGPKTGKLRIGLVWAGRPAHQQDAFRSISLDQLSSILAVPDVEFFSLQIGPAAQQAARHNIHDFTADLHDFRDTAALIDHLDLVVTVDTAVAHLAGAMAKPVWVLLTRVPDWRWMLDRPDSPWYPTMRLFRQPKRGDWTTPINSVAAELAQLAR